MRKDHRWFTGRAELTWRATPGRSLLALIPSGCLEADAGTDIENWVRLNLAPSVQSGLRHVAVVRGVPDRTTSCGAFLSQLEKAFTREIGSRLILDHAIEASERLEVLVEAIHEQNLYPVIIIERFHSFASIADDALLALLSSMRSMEHAGQLTTIVLSPVGYDVIRRRLSQALPFVNSAYGDNHDHAVMTPLRLDEFLVAAQRLGVDVAHASSLYGLGGGPDLIYQALLDEGVAGLEGIENRCVVRLGDFVSTFLTNAVGDWKEHIDLYKRVLDSTTSRDDRLYLRRLPHASFVFQARHDTIVFSGAILTSAVNTRLRSEVRQPEVSEKRTVNVNPNTEVIRILFVAANADPEHGLDLEEEMRSLEQELAMSQFRSRVEAFFAKAARPADLVTQLRKYRPQVLHFSGHGSEKGISMRLDEGGTSFVGGEAFADTLKERGVRLVFVNACSSGGFGEALAEVADAVITTSEAVADIAARRFSAMLYQGICNGHSVKDAFRDASDTVRLYGLKDVFELRAKSDVILVEQ